MQQVGTTYSEYSEETDLSQNIKHFEDNKHRNFWLALQLCILLEQYQKIIIIILLEQFNKKIFFVTLSYVILSSIIYVNVSLIVSYAFTRKPLIRSLSNFVNILSRVRKEEERYMRERAQDFFWEEIFFAVAQLASYMKFTGR